VETSMEGGLSISKRLWRRAAGGCTSRSGEFETNSVDTLVSTETRARPSLPTGAALSTSGTDADALSPADSVAVACFGRVAWYRFPSVPMR
jgi:hypothetical protein